MQLAAKWIVPISSPPLQDGVIVCAGERIVEVLPRRSCRVGDLEDLGDVLILPGFINAHTHLELSHLRGALPGTDDVVDWLRQVVLHQRRLQPGELRETTTAAVRAGAAASLDAGVTMVGDVSRYCQWSRPLLQDGPLGVVSYGEVLGIGARRQDIVEALGVASGQGCDSRYLKAALSPHAPYSVEGPGVQAVAARARELNMQLCMHLSESTQELQFLQSGQGPFRDMLESIGVWDDAVPIPRTSPIRWAGQLGVLGPRTIVAHANYADAEEIELLCASGSSVAYCPRTHDRFRHARYPLEDLLGAGVNVCIATDSLASSPSLSVLEELSCAAAKHPGLSAATFLAMGTINAARALDAAGWAGSLQPGKQADVAVLECEPMPRQDPERGLLSGRTRLARLYIRGQRVR